jgi:hypothetical protein
MFIFLNAVVFLMQNYKLFSDNILAIIVRFQEN